MKLQTKILVGLVAGVVVGAVSKIGGAEPLARLLLAIEPAGTMFIRLISMVVIPLVVASLFVGIAAIGDVRKLGRVGGRTLAYFAGSTALAACIGLAVAVLTGVGRGAQELAVSAGPAAAADPASVPGFWQTIVDMVPTNVFASAVKGDLLPLIVGVCLFAAATTVIAEERRRPIVQFFDAVNDTAMVVVRWLMVLAPPAVFVLIAATVARSGADLLSSLAGYMLVAVVAMLVHVVIILGPALVFGAKQRVMPFVRAVSDALMMAFSTASSNATLPVSIDAARNRLGASADVVSFVLPAGATINKNGAAVYKAVTAVFVANLYGVPLDAGHYLTIALTATVAAFAGAGVPGSSLVTTLIVLQAIGLGPRAAAGIALVAGIDRPLDMVRSAVNTLSNLVGTMWISRTTAARP